MCIRDSLQRVCPAPGGGISWQFCQGVRGPDGAGRGATGSGRVGQFQVVDQARRAQLGGGQHHHRLAGLQVGGFRTLEVALAAQGDVVHLPAAIGQVLGGLAFQLGGIALAGRQALADVLQGGVQEMCIRDRFRPGIWPNCRSSGEVTSDVITSGLAPGYSVVTWMVG